MIRIFPDFSVQVTAAGGGAGGMPSGHAMGRVPGTTNGNPQNVQGITSYQQRYVDLTTGEMCFVLFYFTNSLIQTGAQ